MRLGLKISKWSFAIIFTFFCVGVASYALHYMDMDLNIHNTIQMKLAQSGWPTPGHIIGGGLALLLVPLQLSTRLRQKAPGFHRVCGWLYALAVVISGVSGFALALNAEGGAIAGTGFATLSILWITFTGLGVYWAIKGDISRHRSWLQRSMALTTAAITLRLILGVGLAVFKLPYLPLYIFTAWGSWLINLFALEAWRNRRSIIALLVVSDKRSVSTGNDA